VAENLLRLSGLASYPGSFSFGNTFISISSKDWGTSGTSSLCSPWGLGLFKLFVEVMAPREGWSELGLVSPWLLLPANLSLVAAVLLTYYAKTMALAEQAKRYQRMVLLFGNAHRTLREELAGSGVSQAQTLSFFL